LLSRAPFEIGADVVVFLVGGFWFFGGVVVVVGGCGFGLLFCDCTLIF
jgi:hypothetical protein